MLCLENGGKKGKCQKVKSPYFTSVARNSHLNNKLEAQGALIPPPPLPSIRAPFYGSLKLLYAKRKGNKSKVWSHLGIDLRASCTEGRALTNCANPSPNGRSVDWLGRLPMLLYFDRNDLSFNRTCT